MRQLVAIFCGERHFFREWWAILQNPMLSNLPAALIPQPQQNFQGSSKCRPNPILITDWEDSSALFHQLSLLLDEIQNHLIPGESQSRSKLKFSNRFMDIHLLQQLWQFGKWAPLYNEKNICEILTEKFWFGIVLSTEYLCGHILGRQQGQRWFFHSIHPKGKKGSEQSIFESLKGSFPILLGIFPGCLGLFLVDEKVVRWHALRASIFQ